MVSWQAFSFLPPCAPPRVSLAPKTPFPNPFKCLPHRLNLSLAGGFMNKIKSLNTSFGAAQGGKTQVERLDVTYLSPGC